MRCTLLLLTSVASALVVCGCDRPGHGSPTTPSPRPMRMHDDSGEPNRARWSRLDDLDPEIAARLREQMADPDANQRLDEAEEIARSGPVQYGITDAALPGGAVAAVVRDPHASVSRLLVLSEHSLSDRSLSLARHALAEDEWAMPRIASRRLVYVWDDQRFESPGRSGRMEYRISGAPRGAAEKLRAAEHQFTLAVPGIGPVRIARVRP
jgi:hypothetical protein